jgi:cellulose synthase/poly-beta-1,6-N-acetylglucosamine synthase-like glycosyltransferase
MLLTVTLILFGIIAVIDIVHYGALFLFLQRLGKDEWKKPEADFTPKTLVLLALRGADPFLPRCLESLFTQNYPNYRVRILLDSAEDPALPIVKQTISKLQADHAEIMIIDEHLSSCALKCNSLSHGVADLDPSFEAVAVLDADTNPPKDWLKRLVEPLSDPQFPAASGLRWYMPEKPNIGSLVRYLWNAAAIVQQNVYQIAWGGSMALRCELFTEGKLGERWKNTVTDDTPVTPAVKSIGGKIAFVSALFMPNREICSLASFHRWVKRQMLCVKLYHPVWGAVAGQAVLLAVPLLALFGTLFAGVICSNGPVIVWSLASFALYWSGVFGTLPILERAIRRKLLQRGEQVEKWTFSRTWRTFAAIPLTQIVYTSALFWLHFLRRVEWRGAEYDICGKEVRLVEYKPYTEKPANEYHSL